MFLISDCKLKKEKCILVLFFLDFLINFLKSLKNNSNAKLIKLNTRILVKGWLSFVCFLGN